VGSKTGSWERFIELKMMLSFDFGYRVFLIFLSICKKKAKGFSFFHYFSDFCFN
jgi:hypothetical protein